MFCNVAFSSLIFQDYYPGGMPQPGRGYVQTATSKYKFGYQGSEKDDDINGKGNYFTTEFREGDTRLMRWWSPDPKVDLQPWQSPYNYMDGNPVLNNDPDGDLPIETVWDIANVIYDIGAAVYNHSKGDHKAARSNWADAGLDLAATLIPYVPAGASKFAKVVTKADDVIQVAKKINKNSNNAEGNFVLYEVKDGKKILKIGKADADRVTSSGDPVRMKASERAAKKAGYPNAVATVKKPLGKTTTGKAKESEAAEVRNQRANGNPLPLNKEKDKRYKP
ncbi:MAG: hypothetical protein EAZ64_06015 [Sphingobacteriales bacterium]|nr:MAG: hypothetical protein EAZ64_06015 [Sphingobacteriales bacterium]